MSSKIGLNVREASEASGLCRQKIYDALNADELRGYKVGTRTVILLEDLRGWLSSREPYAANVK